MDASPPAPRPLPGPALQVAVIAVIAAALWLLYGPGFLGVDAMWSVVWGRDLVHLSALSTSGTTTPHVLSNLIGAALTPLGSDADLGLIAIAFLSAAGLVWGSALIAREIAGTAAGLIAGLLIACREQVLYATRAGFLDVIAAALVVWGVLLLVRWRGERLRGAAVLLALAGLLRPEPWVLLALIVAVHWWRTRRRSPLLIALTIGVPVLWAAADLVLSGDALFSLNETRRVSALMRAGQQIPTGIVEQVSSVVRNLARTPGPETLALALAAAALLLWPGQRMTGRRRRILGVLTPEQLSQLQLTLGAAAVIGGVVAAEGLTGTLVFARFLIPVAGLLAAVVAACVVLAIRAWRPRQATPFMVAVAVALLVLAAPLLLSARRTTDPEQARYADARAVLRAGVPCEPIVVPGLNFRAYAAAWTNERGDAVLVAAQRVPSRGVFVDAQRADARKLLLDPAFPQRRTGGVGGRVVRAADGWVLRARCQ